jgi:hypothetical protein
VWRVGLYRQVKGFWGVNDFIKIGEELKGFFEAEDQALYSFYKTRI